MSPFLLFLTLLPVTTVIIIVVAIMYEQKKRQKEFLLRHRQFLGDVKKYRVLWLPPNKLSLTIFNKELQKKIAYLACAPNQLRIAIGGDPRQDDVKLVLAPGQCEIRQVKLGTFASRFATLIELKLPRSSAFLVAVKNTALSPKETHKLFADLSTYFPQRQERIIRYRWEIPLLAVIGIALVASIGYAFYHATAIEPTGPIGMTRAPSGKLLTFNRSTISFFDEQGSITDQYHNPDHDYRAIVFADDDRYYAMNRKSKSILVCQEGECLSSLVRADPPLADSLSLIISTDGQYLITVEPGEDRVRVFTSDGRQHQTLARPDHAFCFPNGGTFGRDGRFYLTDTNLNRVVAFDFIDGRLHEQEEYLMVRSRPDSAGTECAGGKFNRYIKRRAPEGRAKALEGARNGRVWPMDIAQLDDGRWAVLIASNGMRNADIVLFNEDWSQPEPLTMPSGSDITAIVAWNGCLAASDFSEPGLWTVQNRKFGQWQDGAFQEWMQLIETQRADYLKKRILAMNCPLLAMLLLLISFIAVNYVKLKRLARNTGAKSHNPC